MNQKMTAAADEIGRSILQHYDREYLDSLFSCGFVIEDIIFQILVECCRYAYLKNADKHPLKYYIERDGLELERERRMHKRIIDYINEKNELEHDLIKKNTGYNTTMPDTKPTKQHNRFPSYEFSEFQYWELRNIHDMALVKAILEKRIGSSKKVPVQRFVRMAAQYDAFISSMEESYGSDAERTVFSSLVLFTLETLYSFNFFYEVATEMEKRGISDIPDNYDRLMTMAGSFKSTSCLPDICPDVAHDNDRFVRYPMIIQRRRFIEQIVSMPIGSDGELSFAGIIEANVLANAVQSHIYLNGKRMRTWFAEDTTIDDWADVFKTYNVFRTFIKDKDWTPAKISSVRKMYETMSLDYKAASRKSGIEK